MVAFVLIFQWFPFEILLHQKINREVLAASSLTKTSLTDWQAGKFEWNEINIATSSGDLKLQLDLGSWDASGPADMNLYAYPKQPMVKVGRFIYMIRNRVYGQFMRYDLDSREWKEMAFLPAGLYEVADMTTDGERYIYAFAGRYDTTNSITSRKFLRYDIEQDKWEYLADTPNYYRTFASLVYVSGTTDYIYALEGYGRYGFWKYNVSTNEWTSLQNSTYYCENYCDMVYDGSRYIYFSTSWYDPDRFYRYDTQLGTWSRMADAPINNAFHYGTSLVKVGDYIYTPRGNNTRTFYRYSITNNTWDTAADLPAITYYASAVYDDDDNRIIVYGGRTNFWYYYPETNSWSDPLYVPTYTYDQGNNFISDGSGNFYWCPGRRIEYCYKYVVSTGTWLTTTNAPATLGERGVSVALSGQYLYVNRGNYGNTFYRYDTNGDSWTTLTSPPATLGTGSSMVSSGSAIFALRGEGRQNFYRYDIAGDSWTSKANTPEGVYRGSGLVKAGDYIYALQGYNSGGFWRYNETENSWERMANLPVGSYYGGGMTYDGGDYIYAIVGGATDIYSRQFYRYSISQNRWERMADTPEMVKSGAGITFYDGKVWVLQGNYGYGFWRYTPPDGTKTYVTSGTWYSPAYDLTYVSSWGTFSATTNTPSGTSVSFYSRTSDYGNKWSDWQQISGGVIASPAKRYIQIKIVLSGDGSDSPTVSDFTINYTGDENPPSLASLAVSGYSQENGTSLTSGGTYSYTNPYFSWSGASDSETGIDGYYVYFGNSSTADPATLGNFQYTTDYTVTTPMEYGETYYLRIKAKDKAGNVSSAATGFTYVYQGISPVSSVSIDKQVDWDNEEASKSGVYNGSASWWNAAYQYRRQLTVTAGDSALTNSSVIKVNIDTDALEQAGKVRADRKDWRILYWDGNYWEEVARDYESASETFFNLVKGIPANQSDSNYYVYYGNANETSEPETTSLASFSTYLDFDGGDYAQILSQTNFPDGSEDRTVMAWVYQTGYTGTINHVFHYGNNSTNQSFGIAIWNDGKFGAHEWGVYTRYGSVPLNEWVLLAITLSDNNVKKYYMNGDLVATDNDDSTPNTVLNYTPKIGTRISLAEYFRGKITGVRLYNRALSESEIETIYSGGEVSSGLVGYWIVEGDSGQTLTDASGNNNNGQLGSTAGEDSNDPTWYTTITASSGNETERPVDAIDTDLILEPMTKGSWAGYQLPPLPRNLRFVYGAAVWANNALYVLRGYNTTTFYKLDLSTGTWTQLANTPGNMYRGATLVWDGNDSIYASRGENTTAFYKYTISTDTWSDEEATDPSMAFYYGAVGVKAGNYIYYVRGSNSTDFLRYDIVNNSWTTLTSAPYGVSYGAGLAWDGGDTIWLYNGGTGLSKYSISQNTWAANNTIALMPYEGSDAYNGMVYDGENYLYVFGHFNRGYSYDSREYVWRYDISNNIWEKVNTNLEYGPIFGAVAYDGSRYAYIIQGYDSSDHGTRSLYRFDVQTQEFLPKTPPVGIDRYFIDNDGEYWYPRIYTGTSLAYDGDDTIYYLMGSDDEFKFKKYVISQKKWYALPPIPCWYQGAGMAYANGYLYAVCANNSQKFFRYDSARENWQELSQTPDTINNVGPQALVYDGNDTFYLLRGNNSTTLYKYTISTDTWETESSSVPATPGWGASLVYDGSGKLYVFRGNNSTSFYEYDLSTQTWTTLTPAPAAVYYGGSAVYNDGRIYLMVGNRGTSMYVYDVASDTWFTGVSTQTEVYAGGYLVKGPGNTAYATYGYFDMLFRKFNLPSEESSFTYQGTYTSKVFDLGNPYAFAGLSATVASPSGTMITFETRTSTDSASWSDWAEATELKQIQGTTFSYKINSTPARYLQFRVTLDSFESDSTPTISDVTISYYNDETAPTNPSTLSAYRTSAKTAEIEDYTWYNSATPYFEWSGASDGTGSGIAGYYVYFGSDEDADASVSGTLVTSASYTASLSTDGEYYLKIKAVDNAGNVAEENWEAFHYRYDGTPPNAPSSAIADPRTYTNTNNYTMFWLAVSDVTSNATSSGILGYYYKTATTSGELANYQLTTATQVTGITAYQEGSNLFYLKAQDNAGNDSEVVQVTYYYGGSAPTAPTNLTVTPSSSTSNSFAFDWDEPESYQGSISEYRYSINSLPSATNYSSTQGSFLSAGAYATVKGTNVFYVVAVDEAGNVNYNAYASVEFTANTQAPGIPLNPEAFDNSIRATKTYRVGLTWDPPTDTGSSFGGYAIYASDETGADCSSDFSDFVLVGTTAGTSYVVTTINGEALESKTYYFCIKAYDTTNQYSAPSTTVSMLPTGRWLTAPDLTSEPTATVKTKSATITWTTSRESNSFVQYGTSSGSYGNEVGSSDQVTSHSIQLTGLNPGTTYYYKVLWTDEDGNQGASDEYTFTTNAAPFVSSVSVSDINLYSAYITFTVKNASSATVQYGKTTSYGGSTTLTTSTSETTYTVKLENLDEGTAYHYRIVAKDEEDNEFYGDDYTFETLPVPKISNLKIQQVIGLPTAALRLLWKTNSPTTTIVSYYSPSSGGGVKDYVKLSLTTDHEALIDNLLDNAEYVLTIKGKDRAGNETDSVTQTVKTASDIRAPEIINLNTETTVLGVGENAKAQIIVTWDTDEPATSQVEYGLGTGTTYNQATTEDSVLTSNHTVTVTGLDTGKIYHLRAISKDKAGNIAYSYDTVIVTPKATKDALNIVIENLSRSFGFLKGMSNLNK